MSHSEIIFPMRLQLPEAVITIFNAFCNAKKKVYVVGGCVRDILVGQKPKDWDMATPCEPQEVKSILEAYRDSKHNYGIHHFPKGESFGVISAMPWIGDHEASKGRRTREVEIATFRKDIGEGRRPESVEFCGMEEDAKRRDLTINAIYYDPSDECLYDYVGGYTDLINNRIRCVGNPMDRFREDPLRVLRYIRFFCRFSPTFHSYKKNVDHDHRKAIAVYAKMGLKNVSPERIRQEFLSGIKQSNPSFFVHTLDAAGLLSSTVFPGCKINLDRLDGTTTEILLASILYDTGSDKLQNVLNKLTYSAEECKRVFFLTKFAEEFRSDRLAKDREIPYRLKKFQESRNIHFGPHLIYWASTLGLNKDMVHAYMQWNLSRSANEVPGTSGLKGKEIGDRMREWDTESFWNKIQHTVGDPWK